MADIVFVQMPFAGLERPSLALGLFTTSLRAVGIPAESVYANIIFAEMIGLPAYFLVGQAGPHMLLGDWIFGVAAFGERAANLKRLPITRGHFSLDGALIDALLQDAEVPDLVALFTPIRKRASELIDELAEDIVLRRRAKVVACTSMFDQHVASLALLQRVKQLDPDVLTVIGGANCAGVMGRATHLASPAVDFTVTGEFDQYAAGFFGALLEAGGRAAVVPLPPNVLGPAYRAGEARHQPLSPTVLLTDLDAASIPDYDDYFDQLYSSTLAEYVSPTIPFETSRGCWWGAKQHCTFCGLNAEGMVFRKKSPARALHEIRALTSRYGTSSCAATDNIIDMSYFQTVLPSLAADEREYRLFYETKANLKREHVETLAAAGCSVIQPGIESLHDETLKIMRKGTTACANIQLLKHCAEFGVAPAWSVLCNFPASEPEWVAEVAADFVGLVHLFPPLGTIPIRFDRFSPYHQSPASYGLDLEPMPSYRCVYPFDDETLEDIAYFFNDRNPVSPAVTLHAQRADQLTRQWHDEFWKGQRPRLVIEEDDGERLRISDTRRCAITELHEFEGPLAALLRALEAPATRAALRQRLLGVGLGEWDEGALCEALDELLRRRLVWRSESQFVALPTQPPRRAIPGTYAGVMLDIKKYLDQSRRRGRALTT